MNLQYRLLPLALAMLPAGALAAALPSVPGVITGETQLLRLRDGRTLWGSIEAHDEEGVHVRRLVGGGLVPLAWDFLDPAQERELRLSLGYVDTGEEEVTIEADRVVLHDGTEIVGRIVNRTDEYLWVKRASGTVPIAKVRVATTSLVRAPALDVYTREELYQERSGELAPLLVREGEVGAEAHIDLAQYAERLLDFSHALEHYRIARALAPDHRPELLRDGLARTEEKAALQEQVDLLAEADQWRGRGLFQRSWDILNAFPQRFPDSPLLEDWNRMRQRVERYQERALRNEVVDRWFHWSARLARAAVREKASFEAARSYADDQLGADVLAAVSADLRQIAPAITADEVRKLWDEREGGRYHQASYGYGTWLLGEERALATPGAQREEEAPEGSQEDARKRLEKRIQRYLANQEVLKKKGERGDEEDPETFWKRWKTDSRAQWLLAYYVEDSGDFRVEKIRFSNCRECGGTGVRHIAFSGGSLAGQTSSAATIECPTCHAIARIRRVRYR